MRPPRNWAFTLDEMLDDEMEVQIITGDRREDTSGDPHEVVRNRFLRSPAGKAVFMRWLVSGNPGDLMSDIKRIQLGEAA